MKHRSPYAKSLNDNKYRQRVIEADKNTASARWMEEALEEYYNGQDMEEKDKEVHDPLVRTVEGVDRDE